MKSQPPRAAVYLLTLFSPPHQTEPILGDLLEEFGQREKHADGWFWRQTLSAIPRLPALQFRAATLRIAIATMAAMFIGGMELIAVRIAVPEILKHLRIYYYIDPFTFWVGYSAVLNRMVTPFLLGWLMARIARGSEMAAVLCFGSIIAVSTIAALFHSLGRGNFPPHVMEWELFGVTSMVLAILAGGIFGRRRLTATSFRLHSTGA